jgi:hypothetical protein
VSRSACAGSSPPLCSPGHARGDDRLGDLWPVGARRPQRHPVHDGHTAGPRHRYRGEVIRSRTARETWEKTPVTFKSPDTRRARLISPQVHWSSTTALKTTAGKLVCLPQLRTTARTTERAAASFFGAARRRLVISPAIRRACRVAKGKGGLYVGGSRGLLQISACFRIGGNG